MIGKRQYGSFAATTFLLLVCMAAAVGPSGAQSPAMPDADSAVTPPAISSHPDLTGALTRSGLGMVPQGFSKLAIAPGFLLQLNVLDDPDYSGGFRVDEQGNIVLPIIGPVHVAGATADDAGAAIAKKLLDGQILKDPQVTVTVLEYVAPQVTILGDVAAPGRYPLLTPTDLSEVLALAGGPTATAGQEVLITGKESQPIHVRLLGPGNSKRVAQDVLVQPGDTVHVERAGIVYVLGAVTRPGGYVMANGGTMTAMEAISMAEGTTMSASVRKIYLLRRNPNGGEEQISLPLSKMQRGGSGDMQLQASDILYVPNSKLKATILQTQGIIASTSNATIFAAAVY